MNWNLYLNFFIAILALINPLSRLPIWKELTGDLGGQSRKKTAFYITSSALAVLLVFLLTGKPILNFFSIDLDVFKLAGGILLLIGGISMVEGEMTSLKNREEEGNTTVVAKKRFSKVIVPMAVPMISGPGSITTVIIFGNQAKGVVDYAILAGMLILNIVIIYLFLAFSSMAEKRVNDNVFTVMTRILGIIVAAIGVQFMVEGIGEIFPALTTAPDVQKD